MANERLQGRVPLLLLALGMAAGCSGKGTTGPTVVASPTPGPPVKTVVMEASIPSLPVDYVSGRYFSTTAAGTLDITVDRTFRENILLIWLARGQCTFEQFDAESCDYVTQSLGILTKPTVLSVPAASAGTYTLIVGNIGPGDESVSYQVVLTSASAASKSVPHLETGVTGYHRAWTHRP
jgi:hypothetical protein